MPLPRSLTLSSRRLPRSLRTASFRLAALYVAVFVLSVGVLGGVVFWTAHSALDRQMTARIETETHFLQAEFASGGVERLLAAVRQRGQGPSALDYLVQGAGATKLAGTLPIAQGETGWSQTETSESDGAEPAPETERILTTDLGGGLRLSVGDDTGRITEAVEAIGRAFLWAIGVMAVVGAAGGLVISQAFLARVDAISRTAEAIIAGDLARRVPLRGTGDDFDHLASALNRMLDRIGHLMETLRQVSTDVAHDLRTPLSQLRQRLEAARSHPGSVADYEAAIEAAIAKAQELERIFSALLRIAQVEGGAATQRFREVDLTALAARVVDAFVPDAEEHGRTLTMTPTMAAAGPVLLRGDQELLTQLLVNLVENALRHTPPGTRIDVSLAREPGGTVRLAVADSGPGIPHAERLLVLTRFYRGERSRTTPGNGLGLSLVAAIAELHQARLVLEDAAPGLRVVLLFAPPTPPLPASAARPSPRPPPATAAPP